MDDLDQLYQSIILDHYKHPRNRRELAPDEIMADEENPLCGDQLSLSVEINAGRVEQIVFDGKGCAISLASASLMSETIAGRTVEEAASEVQQFIQIMRGEQAIPDDWPDELRALGGVRKFALRVKCATLAWHGLAKILARV